MAARIQIPPRAKRGEIVEIRVLIQHSMETGYRHDDVGRVIKRNVINLFSCRYNGVEVFRADLSSGISANPYLQFYTVAEASGDLEFSWIDDEGQQDSERQSIVVNG
ncbi:MAG TPA: thiosulfate oxidation carrier complex protein SoxZ [Burkholderiales bacterium]